MKHRIIFQDEKVFLFMDDEDELSSVGIAKSIQDFLNTSQFIREHPYEEILLPFSYKEIKILSESDYKSIKKNPVRFWKILNYMMVDNDDFKKKVAEIVYSYLSKDFHKDGISKIVDEESQYLVNDATSTTHYF